MPDEELKSAYELAMERLQAEDREQGVKTAPPLNDEQKVAVAELRSNARAKLAELEILFRKDRVAAAVDPEKLTRLEEEYETDRRRVESSLESAIARVRRGADEQD